MLQRPVPHVARRTRALCLAAALAAGSPAAAAAAPRATSAATVSTGTPPAATESPPAAPAALGQRESYRWLLGAMYAAAPLMALGAAVSLSDADTPGVTIAAVSASLFLPATVHIAHDRPGHGVLAFLGMVGLSLVGAVAGAMAGGGISSASCDPDEDSDGCGLAALDGMMLGGLAGATLGYAAFALYDVVEHGETVRQDPADAAALRLWLTPAAATADAPLRSGIHLKASLSW